MSPASPATCAGAATTSTFGSTDASTPVGAVLSQWLPSPFATSDHSPSRSDTAGSSDVTVSKTLLESVRARLKPQRAQLAAWSPRTPCSSPMTPVVEGEVTEGEADKHGRLAGEVHGKDGGLEGLEADSLYLPHPPDPSICPQVSAIKEVTYLVVPLRQFLSQHPARPHKSAPNAVC
jgi:hypothetical protein